MMQSWQDQLQSMEESKLNELYAYVRNQEEEQTQSREVIIDCLLHGKIRYLLRLIDKQAYKTIRRLSRKPGLALDLTRYPIEQLQSIGFIMEQEGQYYLHPQAEEIAKRLAKVRYYDDELLNGCRQDEIILGILHRYGMIELSQLHSLLKSYDIIMEEAQLLRCIKWRIPMRKQFSSECVFEKTYIIMNDIDVDKVYAAIVKNKKLSYTVEKEEELIARADRYHALQDPSMIHLRKHLSTKFSKQFTETIAMQIIDHYQYHTAQFTYYAYVMRSFDPSLMEVLLQESVDDLYDIYHRGHRYRERQKQKKKK